VLRNYLIVAFRDLARRKTYSAINIAGLAVAMACAGMIGLWVQDELSYDRYHERSADIYRLVADGNGVRYAVSHAPLGAAAKEECPEVQRAARMDIGTALRLVAYSDRRFEQRGRRTDPDFLTIFSFAFLAGDPEGALSRPDAVVLTETLAEKLFGSQDPIGKTVTLDARDDRVVTGVIRDLPGNSHLRFDFLQPFAEPPRSWGDWSYYTYALLRQGSSGEKVGLKVDACYRRHKLQADPEAVESSLATYSLQPLASIHMQPSLRFDVEGNSDPSHVHIASAVAVLVLLIASLNHVNLSTARSAVRAREVGIRKAVGSSRWQLVGQFLAESVLLVSIAFAVALLLAEQFLPLFSALAGKVLAIDYLAGRTVVVGAGVVVLVGLTSGWYPAVLLSGLDPVRVLKGRVLPGTRGSGLRKVLVVAQFAGSIGLIICTTVVADQVGFMRHAGLGFDKGNLVYLRMRGQARAKTDVIKSEMLKHPDILSVTASSRLPPEMDGTSGAGWEGKVAGKGVQMQRLRVDHDYLDTYGLEMAQGRFYSDAFPADSEEGIVLNQAAVSAMGMDDPLGKRFTFAGDRRIVGVVRDFHYRPLREAVEPLILRLGGGEYNYLTLRVRPGRSGFSGVVEFLERKWSAYCPEYPFAVRFLDDRLDRLYTAEVRLSRAFGYLTYMAVFIACLGLAGLASFTAERRAKEIGVRKTLGASVPGMVAMLSREYTVWVIASNALAWPIAWYAMGRWLEGFAYRITPGIGVYAMAGSLALVIAIAAVSYQAIRAAMADPVRTLRYE